MKKLLFLGIDTTTADAFAYAKSRDIYTVIADHLDAASSPLKAEADEVWRINVTDLDALEQRCREANITGIYAGSHELCLDSCKQLCERLGLPFYASEKGWKTARDKEIFKDYCLKAGLDIPKKYWIGGYPTNESFDEIRIPVVVKPSDGNAKRGFTKVESMDELWPAVEYALSASERKRIIVEDYIQGYLVSVICFVHNGKLNLADVMIGLPAKANRSDSFGYLIHYSRYNSDIEKNLLPAYERLIKEMECKEGAIFFQSIYRDGKYYHLETGYRLDGVCSWRHIERQTGVNQLKYMVDYALGTVSDEHLRKNDNPAGEDICAGYVIFGKPGLISSIKGKQELCDRADIIVQWDRFKEGDTIPDTNDMTAIALMIEVFGKNHYEIAEKIKEISQTLHYYDAEGNDLLICHDDLAEKWEAFQLNANETA